MKKALKVTFGAVIAVGLIAPLQAHVDNIIDNSAVWVAATYTKSSNNGVSVGDVITSSTRTNDFISYDGYRATFLEPDWDWDYALGARFHLKDSDSHLFVTYDHYRDNSRRNDNNLVNIGVPNSSFNPPSATSGFANLRQNADEFRLGVDRALHFGPRFCVDLSAFLEYDRVVREIYQVNRETALPNYATRDTENRLRGYGPGVGALGRVYPFSSAKNVSFFAGIMNTLLFATHDYSDLWRGETISHGDGNLMLGEDEWILSIDPEQSKSVVGKIDINFGLEYSYHRRDGYIWDIALGMRFMNIFNAFKNGNTMWQPGGGGYYGLALSTGSAEDWGRWGPYLKFTVGGPNS